LTNEMISVIRLRIEMISEAQMWPTMVLHYENTTNINRNDMLMDKLSLYHNAKRILTLLINQMQKQSSPTGDIRIVIWKDL
jgi:hypothetical protein